MIEQIWNNCYDKQNFSDKISNISNVPTINKIKKKIRFNDIVNNETKIFLFCSWFRLYKILILPNWEIL